MRFEGQSPKVKALVPHRNLGISLQEPAQCAPSSKRISLLATLSTQDVRMTCRALKKLLLPELALPSDARERIPMKRRALVGMEKKGLRGVIVLLPWLLPLVVGLDGRIFRLFVWLLRQGISKLSE